MTENEMKISVILPVKNPEMRFLKHAIQSVLGQTWQNYEILLVNDGSRKEAADSIRMLSRMDPRIRYFEQEEKGVSAARNFAAEQAEGTILTYLDGDDMLSPFCFEEAVRLFQHSQSDVLFGGTFYGTEEEIKAYAEKNSEKVRKDARALSGLSFEITGDRKSQAKAECIGEPFRLAGEGYISRGIAGRFIRKDPYRQARISFPEDIRILEDAIWNLEMLKKLRVCYVQSVWYYYRKNESSVSNAYNKNVIRDMEIPLRRIRNEFLDPAKEIEYAGYTRLLMDSLRYVVKCLYGNPSWKAAKGEKRKVREHLYLDEPWKEISTADYQRLAAGRDRKKAFLFRARLLLFVWKLRWKQM